MRPAYRPGVVTGCPAVLFVARSPLGDGSEPLAFVDRMGEVDLRKWCDADAGHLDNGDGTVIGVDHHRADAGLWQRLPVMLVLGDQPGGRGLRSIEDRGDQLVAQRAGKRELGLGLRRGSPRNASASSTPTPETSNGDPSSDTPD